MGIRDERLDRAALMPHRSFAGDSRLDARLESELGRLFYDGVISESEFEAGLRYAKTILVYLKTTDSPSPFGNEYLWNIADDYCFQCKMHMASARTVLKDAGPYCERVVDRVAVYDEPLRDGELGALMMGLRALAGGPSGGTVIAFPFTRAAAIA